MFRKNKEIKNDGTKEEFSCKDMMDQLMGQEMNFSTLMKIFLMMFGTNRFSVFTSLNSKRAQLAMLLAFMSYSGIEPTGQSPVP